MKMKYFTNLSELFENIEVKNRKCESMSFNEAVSKIIKIIKNKKKNNNKIFIIGNGGSAAIASHIATDFIKNNRICAISLSDPSLVTCISNDFGYDYVFAKPLESLCSKGDVLFSISSSGASKNILNATIKAKNKGCAIFTLSGFDRNNSLSKMGDINFYVPSNLYGYVEITHLAICHLIVDYMKANGRLPHR